MKTKLRITTFMTVVLFGTICPFAGYGQNFSPTQYNDHFLSPKNLGLTTPQTSDFAKYGNIEINHYNGLLNLDIPLSGYKDRDFDLPLSIKYLSSGFVPAKRPGLVGVNWILNFGGVITRQVQDYPDDAEKGLLNAPSLGTLAETQDKLWNLDITGDDILQRDWEPDIFSFSMGNHRGDFIIGNDGQIKSLSNDKQYKIDISQMPVQESWTNGQPSNSVIKITAPDGYIYEFGGDISFLEYTIPSNSIYCEARPYHIVAWHLKSITAPNRRKADFKYNSVLQPYQYTFLTRYSHEGKETISHLRNGELILDPLRIYENIAHMIEMNDKINVPIISRVEIDGDTKISFTTGNKDRFYDNTDEYSKCLSAIKYYNQGEQLRGITFSYNTYSPYYFLSSLTDNGNTYNFFYNSVANITPPSPKTISVDHWGFWTGANLIDPDNVWTYLNSVISHKNVNTAYTSYALLNRVEYPTKGYTDIEYEPNTYRTYYKNAPTGMTHIMDSTTSDVLGGGARVKKLTDEGGVVRIFEYREPFGNTSSGVIGLAPRYAIIDNLTANYDSYLRDPITNEEYIRNHLVNVNSVSISTNNFGTNNLLGEYHIGYSDVIERFPADGSYIHYNYTSRKDIPNKHNVNARLAMTDSSLGYVLRSSLNTCDLAEKHQLFASNDMGRFRGKLLSKTYYNSSNSIVKKIETKYNDPESTPSQFNVSFRAKIYYIDGNRFDKGRVAYRIYLKPCLVTEEKITESNVSSTIKYYYNSNNQLTRTETTNSDNSVHSVTNKYATDYSYSSLNAGGQWLVDKNMIEKPLLITQKIKNEIITTESVVKAVKFDYKVEQSIPLIQSVSTLESENPVVEGSSAFNNGFKIRETYNKYDSYGNPLSVTKANGTNVVYLWGYKGQYPIVEILNATYAEVNTTLGQAPESISAQLSPNVNQISTTLRQGLPRSLITDYIYKPYVGITKITDPSGKASNYTYDSFGRLSAIRDDQGAQGNLLQEFAYTIGQNSNIRTTTYTAAGGASNYKDFEFYDGLGYPVQKISVGASPKNNQSIITPVYYDNKRRASRQYQPYAASNNGTYIAPATALTNQQTFYDITYNNGAFSTADAQKAYTENIYEASPLNRVMAAFNVGSVFRSPTEKKSTFVYGTNTTNEVMLFKVNSSGMLARSASLFYNAQTLHKNTVTNEDGMKSTTYTDLLGHVVMERTEDGSTKYDTYYVYDNRGNLCYVLPPKLADLKTSTTAVLSDTNSDMKELAYVYKYDGRNRCIEKRLPGAEPVYMVYDRSDRVVLTQDGNQRPSTLTQQQWLFSRYDNLNRLVSQSLVRNTGGVALTTLRSHFNGANTELPTGFSTVAVLTENNYGE